MKYMLPLALLAYVLLASPAQADTKFLFNSSFYCQAVAQAAVIFAGEREEGRPLESVLAETAQQLANEEISSGVAQDSNYVAEYVFRFPRNSPTQEGNAIYALCRE